MEKKDYFKDFLHSLGKCIRTNNENDKEPQKQVKYIINSLFYTDGNNGITNIKVDFEKHFLSEKSVINFVSNYYESGKYNDITVDYPFYNSKGSKALSENKGSCSNTGYKYKTDDNLDNYLKSLYFDSEALFELYKRVNPFPWITADLNLFDENKKIFYCLLYLFVYIGRRYNRDIVQDSYNLVNPSNTEINKLYKTIDSKKRIILKGDFRSGKTLFLKQFAKQNRKKIFYLNAKYDHVTNAHIFNALRPDYDFWHSKELANIVSEDADFSIPLLPMSSIEKDGFISTFLNNLPQDDILIIDNVKDLDIIKRVRNLPCKVIFSVNASVNCSRYGVSTFCYDNTLVLNAIIEKAICSELQSADPDKRVRKTKKIINLLHRELGNNVQLFQIVAINHMKYLSDHKNNSFIKALLDNKTFNDLDCLFQKYSNTKIIVSFDNKTENNYFEAQVARAFREFFGDIERKNNITQDRNQLVWQQYLRILYRLKRQGVKVSEFKESLAQIPGFLELLNYLGFIKRNRICVPDIVAHAFNRTDRHNNPFSYRQYNESLVVIRKISDYIFSSRVKTDKKLIVSFINAISDDLEFLKERSKLQTVDQRKVDSHNNRIQKGKVDFETINADKRNDFIDVFGSPFSKEAVRSKDTDLYFYHVAISYALKYNERELYLQLVDKASRLDRGEDWGLFIEITKAITNDAGDLFSDRIRDYLEIVTTRTYLRILFSCDISKISSKLFSYI